MSPISRRGRRAGRVRTSLAPDRVAVGSYIDTVVLKQDRKIDDDRFAKLQESFGPGRGKLKEDIVHNERPSLTGYVVHTLALHRPTIETIRYLDELLQHGQTIKEIHVALDVLVESLELANAWQDFLEGHLITNPKAPLLPTVVETTTYYNAFLAAGERYALYSDKPARLAENMMCCHLEARIIGPDALKSARLDSPSSILHMNHRKFWDKRLDFRRPPSFEKIARASNKSSNSRQPTAIGDKANQERAMDLLHSSRNERGKLNAQTLLANMRATNGLYSTRPIRHFSKQRHFWLLPSRLNVHWHPEMWA